RRLARAVAPAPTTLYRRPPRPGVARRAGTVPAAGPYPDPEPARAAAADHRPRRRRQRLSDLHGLLVDRDRRGQLRLVALPRARRRPPPGRRPRTSSSVQAARPVPRLAHEPGGPGRHRPLGLDRALDPDAPSVGLRSCARDP